MAIVRKIVKFFQIVLQCLILLDKGSKDVLL